MAILKKKTDTPSVSEGQKATTEKELLPYAPFQEEGVTGGRSGYSLQDNVRWLRSGNGDEVIAMQGYNGHKLAVSNIHIQDSATVLKWLTSGPVPESVLNEFKGQHILTAIVDGKNVMKPISEEDYQKSLKLTDSNARLQFFNEIFGVKEGNSIQVADKMSPSSRLYEKIDLSKSRNDVNSILDRCDNLNKIKAATGDLNITSLRIGRDIIYGKNVLQACINGENYLISLTNEEFRQLSAYKTENIIKAQQTVNNPDRIEVISAVDLAKRYLGDTPEAQEAAKEDFISKLPPEQREVAQYMQDKMVNWLKDNPMLLYGEKDGKPFLYDMTDREYDKYMVLNDQQKEKYLQKLFTSKEAAAAPANENKEEVAVQANANLNQDGATVDKEKKGQMQAASNGQKFGLLELLKALLQVFGFISPEQERKAEVKNDVAETQQNRQDQQEPKESTTVDRSIAEQAKALSEANTESLVAEQQQGQEVSRGMHI